MENSLSVNGNCIESLCGTMVIIFYHGLRHNPGINGSHIFLQESTSMLKACRPTYTLIVHNIYKILTNYFPHAIRMLKCVENAHNS